MNRVVFCLAGTILALAVNLNAAPDLVADFSMTSVDRPVSTKSNSYYIGNRLPLSPAAFLPLPIGAIEPQGWVAEYLKRQRNGLTGHLEEISIWLQKDGNAWLSKDGKGKYGWEELPYWLKGYGDLAYIFNDSKMIAETKVWIEGAINSQRSDGDFGPDQHFDDDGSRDYWANMIMLFSLQSYYDHSSDKRVLELMTKYFKYELTVPDDKFLTHYWQKMRGGDNLYSVYWLYNRTGDAFLLELAAKIHRVTANWEMPGDLPNWHNVNIAEGFREPATWYLQSHDSKDLRATYDDFHIVRDRYGQVPGGMFGSDENSRPGYTDPHQAIETCGIVEQMLSDEILLRETGDSFWADHAEEVAFNTYPAAVMPDFRALRYLTAPNMVLSDEKDHSPGISNSGPFLLMNPFSSRCCQHNHSHGWPYFSENLWLATPDNGLCAAIYAPSAVTAKVGNGMTVKWTEETEYPFDDTLHFQLSTHAPVAFPFYLRIPAWCKNPKIIVNGRSVEGSAKPGQYACIDRQWNDGDEVMLQLPMEINIHRWTANHNSATVDYGPLSFSLLFTEINETVDSTKTAMDDSGWQKTADPSRWPSTRILPGSAWNYGLVMDETNPSVSFTVQRREWPKDDFPFTPESVPILIAGKGSKIPQWRIDDHGLVGVLQDSPVKTEEPVEDIILVPMGAARLRISAFPVVSHGPEAHEWLVQTSEPHSPIPNR